MRSKGRKQHPRTPDGRYFVVRGRLWRLANPDLSEATRSHWVGELMHARRAVRAARGDAAGISRARARVHQAKTALGERGAPWWLDGTADYNRQMVWNTPYADWYAGLTPEEAADR